MKAKVHVTLKNGVLDPQGKAVQHALDRLGFDGIEDVRQGKFIELELSDTDADVARARRLGREADDAEHREAAVLDLLELLLGVLLRRVVEAEGVPAARALAEGQVPGT